MDDLTQLVRAIEARRIPRADNPDELDERRFTVTQEGDHQKVRFGGQIVLDAQTQKPVVLPTTPSDSRWRDNAVTSLIRAGVLEQDPKREGQAGLTPEQEAEREEKREHRAENKSQREAMVAATRERHAQAHANTTVQRDRAERLFGTIGVWKEPGRGHSGWRGTIAEVARVAYHWSGNTVGAVTITSESAAKDALRRLYRNEGLRDDRLAFVRDFLDHLEVQDNPARRYNELLRALLGVTEVRSPVAAVVREPEPEPQAEPEPEPEDEPEAAEPEDERLTVPVGTRMPIAVSRMEARILELEQERDDAAANAALVERERDQVAAHLAEAVARGQSATNGDAARVALKALAEMVGTLIIAEGASVDSDLLDKIDEKRDRSLGIANEILELGA